jgi:hypothetical protein
MHFWAKEKMLKPENQIFLIKIHRETVKPLKNIEVLHIFHMKLFASNELLVISSNSYG